MKIKTVTSMLAALMAVVVGGCVNSTDAQPSVDKCSTVYYSWDDTLETMQQTNTNNEMLSLPKDK